MGITTHFQTPSLRQELLETLFLFIPDTDVVLNVYEKLTKINVERAREWHMKRWGGWEIIVDSPYTYSYYSASYGLYGSGDQKTTKNICVCRDMYEDDGSCIKRKIKGWGWKMPTIPPDLLRDIELLGNYFHKERCDVFIPGTRFRKQWGMNAISISSRVKDINQMNHLVKIGMYNVEMGGDDDYKYVDIDEAYVDLFIVWARKYFKTSKVYKESPYYQELENKTIDSVNVREFDGKKSQYLKMFTKSWNWWSDKSNKNIHREMIGTW
jgi:hypothetical protein